MKRFARCPAAVRPHEVVLVVAVTLLCATVFLPAIGESRQNARIIQCLANLRTLGEATGQYYTVERDFPFALPFNYRTPDWAFPFGLATEFSWGGGMPDKTAAEYTAAGVGDTGAFNPGSVSNPADVNAIPPRYRALNPYIDPSVSWDDGSRDPQRSTNNPRTQIPMELPGVFKCPDDYTANVPFLQGFGGPPPAETPGVFAPTATDGFPTWQYWGTSYAANWYWFYYYSFGLIGGGDFEIMDSSYANDANILGLLKGVNGVRGLSSYMFERGMGGDWESRFVILMENRMNEALSGARPCGWPNGPAGTPRFAGWHGDRNGHAALLFDGHATYAIRNTNRVQGDDWTVWPAQPWTGVLTRFENVTCEPLNAGSVNPLTRKRR